MRNWKAGSILLSIILALESIIVHVWSNEFSLTSLFSFINFPGLSHRKNYASLLCILFMHFKKDKMSGSTTVHHDKFKFNMASLLIKNFIVLLGKHPFGLKVCFVFFLLLIHHLPHHLCWLFTSCIIPRRQLLFLSFTRLKPSLSRKQQRILSEKKTFVETVVHPKRVCLIRNIIG